jgi:hypothetical protein
MFTPLPQVWKLWAIAVSRALISINPYIARRGAESDLAPITP